MEQNTAKNKFQYPNVILISLSHLIHDIYTSFLAPVLPLLVEKLQMSYASAGMLSIFQRLPSLTNPFVGILADKVSVRYFVILAPAFSTVLMSLIGIAPSYTALSIILFLTGINSTLFHVPAPVMIKKISGNKVGRGMSFFMFGGEIARTLGPLIILAAVSIWGLEGTYRLFPFGIIASIFLYIRLKNIKISDDFSQKDNTEKIGKSLKTAAPTIIISASILFFRAFMKSALTAFLPLYITEKGNTIWLGGVALTLLQLSGALGTFLMGSISDRIGRKNTLAIATISSSLLMGFFIYTDGITSLIVLSFLGFSIFAVAPVLLALVQDINSKRPAFINGTFMGLNFIISAISIFILGIASDYIGLEQTYLGATIISFGAIPLVFFIKK